MGTDKTRADVLREAAQIIADQGWAQGQWLDGSGPVCMDGALGLAERGRAIGGASAPLYDFVWQALGESPIGFNDLPGRTAEEVINALRTAADAAEREALA